MAAKSQKLTFQVAAESDQAKKALDQLERQAKKLEQGVEVPLTLEGAKEASDDLAKAAAEAKALATILQHTEGMGNVAEDAQRSAKELEAMAREAKKVEAALKEVHGVPPPDPGATRAAEQLTTLERSAGGAKNAMANLVGNTAQDMSGLLGPLGSVGVAIGQVAEYATDAANEGGGLTAALKGAASMAGPLAALALGSLAVQKVIGDIQKRSQEAKEANDALRDSFVESTGVLGEWRQELEDAAATDGPARLNKAIADMLEKTGDLEKTGTALGQLGIDFDDLGTSIVSADKSFASWAKTLADAQGIPPSVSENVIRVVQQSEKLEDVLKTLRVQIREGIIPPEEGARALDLARGYAQFLDVVEKTDLQKQAKEANDLAKANKDLAATVNDARAAGETEIQVQDRVIKKQAELNRAKEEAARVAEEGAKAVADAGTIQERALDQLTIAERQVADAARKAKEAQDDWLVQNVTYEDSVDGFTESLQRLTDQTKKQAEAGEEGAGSFEGNTKAALDNRDALRDVYGRATEVIQGMKDAGFSVDGAREAQNNMAESAYQLAIRMGYPIEKAKEIRDKINQIPPSVTSEVKITETGYEERLAEMERLERDIHNTVYFAGVLDRSLQQAIDTINWNAPPGTVIRPSVASAAGLQAVAAPVVAPSASPGLLAAPSASRTTTVPVIVNVNAGLVADTFQLQRAVVRSARSFQRLAGKRAA